MTWSIPRRPSLSHSLVNIENNSHFVVIRPIRDVDSQMYISTYFPPLYVVLKIGLITIRSFLILICFQIFFSWHWIMFCNLFRCRIRKMYIQKVYIYLPYINTQRWSTSPFDDTPIVSPRHSKYWNTGLYQGSDDRCEGDRDSDLNLMASAILVIQYYNQPVLAIALDLNVTYLVLWSLISFQEAPWYCLVYYMWAITTTWRS